MTSIKLIVSGASARAEVDGLLTSGMVGIPVKITYDSAWDGLTKAVVCRAGSIVKTILNVGNSATVPHECMIANATLQIGVEGRNADGTLVIPTVWARCGLICSGANAEADPSTDPTLPVWAQIQRAVGNLDNLNTEAKDNLVSAINEALTKGGGEVDPEAVQQIVEGYLAENPPTVTESDPTVPAWAKAAQKPSYTADEVGALSAETLPSAINTALAQAKASGEFDGADGKTAYQYAVDAGYTGSEAAFAERMAAEIPSVDSTLTKAGQAADAAVVGNRLSALSEEIAAETESKVSAHNTGTDTHSDIRLLIQGLADRLNSLADSDDTTLDQFSEIVAYIKSNRSLIEAITTSKVSVADIIDNLTTKVANKPLSAAQGVALKALIDTITVPDKLPNPNALTFTGAVYATYDGSAAVSVEIPSAVTDDHINSLIDTKLGVIENGSY